MKVINLLFIVIAFATQLAAQDLRLKLWPNGEPNKNHPPGQEEYFQEDGINQVNNISEAVLYIYQPKKQNNTGAAIIICPGGGYWVEAIDHEGYQMAEYFKSIGMTAVVLKYRLPYGIPDIPISDVLESVRLVRSKAIEWGLDAHKIGIAGASAGGHLASTAGTHYDLGDPNSADPLLKLSSRPDFLLLLYPVISFTEDIGHIGSRINFIGQTNDWNIVKKYSNEFWVTKDTPPSFFVLADDDKAVQPENSILFYSKLKDYGIPAELHIFAHGGHGFGMEKNGLPVANWPNLFKDWLKAMKIIQ
jgi:Esterase/lipase